MTEIVPWLELLFAPGCEAIECTVAMVNETLRELDLAAEVSKIMVNTIRKSQGAQVSGFSVHSGQRA